MEKKRARFLPCLAAFTVFSSCVASFLWFVPALPASAVTSVQLTPAQTRALFGDEISGSYYDAGTGDYVAATFSYLTTTTIRGYNMRGDEPDYAPSGSQLIIYQSNFQGLTPDSQYYTVRLDPIINLGMLQQFSMVAGFSITAVHVPDDPDDPEGSWQWGVNLEATSTSRGGYPANYWSVLQNGNRIQNKSATKWTTGSAIYDWLSWGVVGTNQTNTRFFVPNLIDLRSDSYFSISDLQITRQGNVKAVDSSSARTLLYMTCPVLTQDYQDNSGGGGNTGTDLTATNMKLDTIISILSMIANNQGSDSGTVDYLDSQAPSDSSSQASADSQFNAEYSRAQADQGQVDSVVNAEGLDSIEIGTNPYSDASDFVDLWNDGDGGTNELILAMTLVPIGIAVLAYILFGKRI